MEIGPAAKTSPDCSRSKPGLGEARGADATSTPARCRDRARLGPLKACQARRRPPRWPHIHSRVSFTSAIHSDRVDPGGHTERVLLQVAIVRLDRGPEIDWWRQTARRQGASIATVKIVSGRLGSPSGLIGFFLETWRQNSCASLASAKMRASCESAVVTR